MRGENMPHTIGLFRKSRRLWVAIVFAAGSVHALNIIPDTVDLRSTLPFAEYTAIPFISNTATDSLILDSISVPWMSIPGEGAQLVFTLVRGPTGGTTVGSYHIQFYRTSPTHVYASGTDNLRRAIPPNTTASLDNPGFDLCIFCPTAKRAAVSAIGDTLKARVVFHSGAQRDSVLFLGIQKISTSILPLYNGPLRPRSTDAFYDASGRAVKRKPAKLPTLIRAPAAR
jgi:hypothetical protein